MAATQSPGKLVLLLINCDCQQDNGALYQALIPRADREKVEDVIVTRGGSGRFATWAYSYEYALTAGLGELAKDVIEGKAQKGSMNDMLKTLGKFTPGANWRGTYYLDIGTGVRAKNQVLVYMDTYVFGKGFLPTTKLEIPEKYFKIQAK